MEKQINKKIRENIEKIKRKMVRLSSFICSRRFQYAKGKIAEELNTKADLKFQEIIHNLENEKREIDKMKKEIEEQEREFERIKDIAESKSYDMFEFYLKEK